MMPEDVLSHGRRPITLLTIALIVNWAVLVWLAWYSYSCYGKAKIARKWDLRIEELRGTIIHLDEVLTMSAHMATATGDLRWEKRYRRFEPMLDAAIQEAMKLSPGAYSKAAQTNAANIKLVEMENRGFGLVQCGRREEAAALLASDEYETQKRIYARGMAEFAEDLSEAANANLNRQQREARLNATAAALAIPLLFFGWIEVLRAVHHWTGSVQRRTREVADTNERLRLETAERKKAEEELRKHRDSLEELVGRRTGELQEVNQQLQQEITKHKRAGQEIKALTRQIEFILGATKTGLDIIDSQFIVRYIDPEWKKIYGEPEGRKCYEYFMGRTHPCPGCGIPKALQTKSVTVTEEVLVKENNRPIQVTTIPFQNEKGDWLVAEVNVDITDRKRAEENLANKASELERSNKELEQFAYIASHDLQEPLRMVSSYTQMLARRYKDRLDTDANEFIGYAVDGANRMQRLINDLLAYSRVATRGKPLKPIDSRLAFRQAISSLEAAIQENHAVVTSDDLPTVAADETQLVQVFQNLIGNAIKFHNEKLPRIHVSAGQKGDQWLFSVRDNGIGIAPEYHERIFVIFRRLHDKGEYPGTGIGLAICKRVVERHGGRIWVESEPEKGSTFYFSLPKQGEENL